MCVCLCACVCVCAYVCMQTIAIFSHNLHLSTTFAKQQNMNKYSPSHFSIQIPLSTRHPLFLEFWGHTTPVHLVFYVRTMRN